MTLVSNVCQACGRPLAEQKLRLNDEDRTVMRGSLAVRLAPRYFRVLAALTRAYPHLVCHERLCEALWGHLLDCDRPEDEITAVRQVMVRTRRQVAVLGLRIDNVRDAGWRLGIGDLKSEGLKSEGLKGNDRVSGFRLQASG